jgi:hypothetical protein
MEIARTAQILVRSLSMEGVLFKAELSKKKMLRKFFQCGRRSQQKSATEKPNRRKSVFRLIGTLWSGHLQVHAVPV